MKTERMLFLALVAGATLAATPDSLHAAPRAGTDVTAKMTHLKSPLAQRYKAPDGYYARNVWTLKAFDGRIFVGCGNSSNGGPAMNAGPVDIYAYDPKTRTFVKEWTAPDEQVDVFREFDGALYLPGHDPKEDWKLGNFYRRKAGSTAWEKVRTIPNGVHCYDLAKRGDTLYASGYEICASTDGGATFKSLLRGPRYYTFLTFPKRLYAVSDGWAFPPVRNAGRKKAPSPASGGLFTIARTDPAGGFAPIPNVKVADVMPGVPLDPSNTIPYKVSRSVSFGDRVLYIAALQHNDHQMVPLAAYTATDGEPLFKPARIPLPDGATPWTFTVAGKRAFLLFSVKEESPRDPEAAYINHVWVSSDGKSFKPLLRFSAPTFARAMEYDRGVFYFGLGTEVKEHGHFKGNSLILKYSADELNPHAGEIWTVREP